ncbi:NAD dependent epimerase/dehydratase [Polychaeton citri CBS 116435]|uniref:NAD dependent epimerase/dehydratase n=1 Tax=Polychaeton citri CBS 116435 TaxID=1314669 RepID=A0A9P4URW8_9PEZI|nr:NAD dependent epimerase/dehydratase [Polychaeton citri CBS 116435]
MVFPSDTALPQGSLILITGANSLVGSHAADQFLKYGYKVRGQVRNSTRGSWMKTLFDSRYGPGKFELVEATELEKPGSLDEAVKGVDGVVHTASILTFSPDPNEVILPAVALVESVLGSAAKESSVKRFVFTSSSSAVADPSKADQVYDVTHDTWADWTLEDAWRPPPYDSDRIYSVYAASKLESERTVWKFVKEKKPHFVANAVLPDFVCGAPLSTKDQGYPSTAGMTKTLWDGQEPFPLAPQHMVGTHDIGALHVAAAIKEDVQNERVFGYAWPKSWTTMAEVMAKLDPGRKLGKLAEGEGVDRANILPRARAEELLKWLGLDGFEPFEDSVKDLCESFE